MQYDAQKTKPESIRKNLVQQVQEQSDLCDVIIKQGSWEKKFHRDVLVMSPFFEAILKDDFLEKQTGMIEIKLATPTTLKMTIMFLYGKRPKLTEANIEHMFYLAEFFLIPNLKSSCMNWLRNVKITENNCIKFLKLSSLFDLDITQCVYFIEEHLSEMLIHPEMVCLTMDSIIILFTDQKLSYVSMEERLKFLLKWRDSRHDSNAEKSFKELLLTIDFNDVSVSYLQELQDNQILIDIDLEQIIRSINESPDKHRVLVMKSDREDGTFWCLDLIREKWFRLHSMVLEEERSYYHGDIAGWDYHECEIYLTNNTYNKHDILVVNLQSDSCRRIKIVDSVSGEDFKTVHNLNLIGDLCVLNVNKREKERVNILNVFTDTSTIYTGVIANKVVQMKSLLTFKGDKITQMCLGKILTVAFLFNSKKYISLYDLVNHTLERHDICIDWNDKLSSTEEGFVVYNNQRCLCLTRPTGSVSTKYELKIISFECEQFQRNHNFLFGEMWYHYYRKFNKEYYMLEVAPCSTVCKRPTADVEWKPLPLPINASFCHECTIKDKCFEICLHKSKLRCDIACPHCKASTSPATYHHDSDDYSYEDSSDVEKRQTDMGALRIRFDNFD